MGRQAFSRRRVLAAALIFAALSTGGGFVVLSGRFLPTPVKVAGWEGPLLPNTSPCVAVHDGLPCVTSGLAVTVNGSLPAAQPRLMSDAEATGSVNEMSSADLDAAAFAADAEARKSHSNGDRAGILMARQNAEGMLSDLGGPSGPHENFAGTRGTSGGQLQALAAGGSSGAAGVMSVGANAAGSSLSSASAGSSSSSVKPFMSSPQTPSPTGTAPTGTATPSMPGTSGSAAGGSSTEHHANVGEPTVNPGIPEAPIVTGGSSSPVSTEPQSTVNQGTSGSPTVTPGNGAPVFTEHQATVAELTVNQGATELPIDIKVKGATEPMSSTPEPSSILLIGTGVVGLGVFLRRRLVTAPSDLS